MHHLRATPLLKVIVKYTVKKAVCTSPRLTAYGELDCEFDFDSQEWSCSYTCISSTQGYAGKPPGVGCTSSIHTDLPPPTVRIVHWILQYLIHTRGCFVADFLPYQGEVLYIPISSTWVSYTLGLSFLPVTHKITVCQDHVCDGRSYEDAGLGKGAVVGGQCLVDGDGVCIVPRAF